MEFDLAKSGTIGLESAYGALTSVLPLEIIIAKLTFGKTLFNIPNQSIQEGNKANITLFSNDTEWIFSKENIKSKSKNSAFLGLKMKGNVYGIYNCGKLILT